MNEIPLQDWIRPDIQGVVVKGTLLRQYNLPEDLSLLDQDILEVELPNGIIIDVGWFPQNKPVGEFIIRTYKQNRHNPLIEPIKTKDPLAVGRIIADLVQTYAAPLPSHTIAVSRASSVSIEYPPKAVA